MEATGQLSSSSSCGKNIGPYETFQTERKTTFSKKSSPLLFCKLAQRGPLLKFVPEGGAFLAAVGVTGWARGVAVQILGNHSPIGSFNPAFEFEVSDRCMMLRQRIYQTLTSSRYSELILMDGLNINSVRLILKLFDFWVILNF